MTKPKIFFAVSNLVGGGAERVVLELARHWTKSEQVAILVAEKRGALLSEVDDHIEIIEVGVPLGVRDTLRFVRRMRDVLADHQPYAVISHLNATNRMLLRTRLFGALKVPLIVVEHNNPSRTTRAPSLRSLLMRLETSILYRQANHLVGVSKGVLGAVRSFYFLPDSKGEVIYNPIDIQSVRSHSTTRPQGPLAACIEASQRPLYIGVGRLVRQKNFTTLIKAFHQIPADRRGTLFILGEGEMRTTLERQVEELGLSGQVLLPGFVSNPWWYMAQADLFVLSSAWEGFSLVLVEAMISGTPYLSTDCPYGPAEINEMFGGGRLVPVGDPVSLAKAMQDCVNHTHDQPLSADFDKVAAEKVTAQYAKLLAD